VFSLSAGATGGHRKIRAKELENQEEKTEK
jgi:hypothetical protein